MEDTNENTQGIVKGRGKAIVALVLGIIAIPGAIIPIIGLPIGIVGLIMGILGRKSSRKGIAIAGIVLSAIALLLSVANAALGAYLAVRGLHPLVQ